MKRTVVGKFDDIEVDQGTTLVQGAVVGATLAADACLELQGAFRGDLTLAAGAVVSIQGTFDPATVTNEGIIMVSGVVTPGLDELDALGNFAASPGTLIGGTVMLEHDGSLTPLDTLGGKVSIDVDGDELCVWLPDQQRFVTQPELKSMGEPTAE